MIQRPLVAVTLGDPGGVGPEVVARALADPGVRNAARVVVLGSLRALERGLADTGVELRLRATDRKEVSPEASDEVLILDTAPAPESLPLGRIDADCGRAAHSWILQAVELCRSGAAAAMATGPVHKQALRAAGVAELGHLEIFKKLSGCSEVYTMLVTGPLRCLHLSTHLPLGEAVRFVTRGNLERAIRTTHRQLVSWGFASPRLAVPGLNPHAGDGGLIGREEIDEIAPAVESCRRDGLDVSGPVPADSVFNQAIEGRFDVVIALYHDQGHIPIKVHGFEGSLSVNVGLPWIRTSVDHGTAFDLAGTGRAQATSMIEAIKLAAALAEGGGLR